MTIRPRAPESTRVEDDLPESVCADLNRASRIPSNGTLHVSTFADLLPFAGTWVGDDFEERLADVYAARGDTEF